MPRDLRISVVIHCVAADEWHAGASIDMPEGRVMIEVDNEVTERTREEALRRLFHTLAVGLRDGEYD